MLLLLCCTLQSHNYFGLKNLMDVLTTLPGICGIVHVSTAFVNCCKPFLPEGSVSERIYPLQFGDREVCCFPSALSRLLRHETG